VKKAKNWSLTEARLATEIRQNPKCANQHTAGERSEIRYYRQLHSSKTKRNAKNALCALTMLCAPSFQIAEIEAMVYKNNVAHFQANRPGAR